MSDGIPKGNGHDEMLVIGIAASTGGPATLVRIFGRLPQDFNGAILVVQHISPGFVGHLVEWINCSTGLNACVAVGGQVLERGHVYVAPTGVQMSVTVGARIRLSDEPSANGFKPSADFLLQSLGSAFRGRAVGVVLTGMGKDGAKGLGMIHRSKGQTIVQSEESCVVPGMPMAAVAEGAVDRVLPPDRIAEELCRLAGATPVRVREETRP